MAQRSIDEIREVFSRAKNDAQANPQLREQFRNGFYKTLASHPYNLTIEEFDKAHLDSIQIDPSCPFYCMTGVMR